jgi:hypothetical protein
MVQAAHAALEAGLKLPCQVSEPSSLILIGVKDLKALYKARRYLTKEGIRTEMFFEPDWNMGHSAFGTEALIDSRRHSLRRFQLWKP